MRLPPVRFHPAAVEEADAAAAWYLERSQRAAEMFIDELEDAVRQIQASPERFSAYLSGTRRMLLRRYPYLIVYRAAASKIEIIAIAHARRRPGYWLDRTR